MSDAYLEEMIARKQREYRDSLVARDTAMKVKYQNRHGEGCDYYNKDYYNCPICGCRLRNKKHFAFCGRCGQRLEWGN